MEHVVFFAKGLFNGNSESLTLGEIDPSLMTMVNHDYAKMSRVGEVFGVSMMTLRPTTTLGDVLREMNKAATAIIEEVRTHEGITLAAVSKYDNSVIVDHHVAEISSSALSAMTKAEDDVALNSIDLLTMAGGEFAGGEEFFDDVVAAPPQQPSGMTIRESKQAQDFLSGISKAEAEDYYEKNPPIVVHGPTLNYQFQLDGMNAPGTDLSEAATWLTGITDLTTQEFYADTADDAIVFKPDGSNALAFVGETGGLSIEGANIPGISTDHHEYEWIIVVKARPTYKSSSTAATIPAQCYLFYDKDGEAYVINASYAQNASEDDIDVVGFRRRLEPWMFEGNSGQGGIGVVGTNVTITLMGVRRTVEDGRYSYVSARDEAVADKLTADRGSLVSVRDTYSSISAGTSYGQMFGACLRPSAFTLTDKTIDYFWSQEKLHQVTDRLVRHLYSNGTPVDTYEDFLLRMANTDDTSDALYLAMAAQSNGLSDTRSYLYTDSVMADLSTQKDRREAYHKFIQFLKSVAVTRSSG
jgi:hypothetical protein